MSAGDYVLSANDLRIEPVLSATNAIQGWAVLARDHHPRMWREVAFYKSRERAEERARIERGMPQLRDRKRPGDEYQENTKGDSTMSKQLRYWKNAEDVPTGVVVENGEDWNLAWVDTPDGRVLHKAYLKPTAWELVTEPMDQDDATWAASCGPFLERTGDE